MLKYVKWVLSGSKMVHYKGYSCTCCGEWTEYAFKVPAYKVCEKDTWGMCKRCDYISLHIKYKKSIPYMVIIKIIIIICLLISTSLYWIKLLR
jgi:hypothetical protein